MGGDVRMGGEREFFVVVNENEEVRSRGEGKGGRRGREGITEG